MTTNRRRTRPRVPAAIVLVLLALSLLPGRAGAVTPDGATVTTARVRAAAPPAVVTAPFAVTTVPAVAGFPVTLDGVTAYTDAAGRAHFDAAVTDAPLEDRVTLTEATLSIDGRQVRVRADRVYPSSSEPLLALDLSYLVTFGFTGADGHAVDPSTVEGLTVKSETGEIVEVPPGKPTWLQGSRVVKRTNLMEVKNLRWSVQRAQLSGSNLVNASQQFFLPAEKQSVNVRLLFFGLQVHIHDAIYGFSSEGQIELVFPDGRARHFPLDADGRLSIPALPRGDYTLTILGPGPGMSRPLAVSRNQDLELAFYSWADVVTVLGVLLALAGGLLWTGQVRRRHSHDDDVPRSRAGRRPLRWRGTASAGETVRPTGPWNDVAVVHALGRERGEHAG